MVKSQLTNIILTVITRDQIANIHPIMEKAKEFQKKTSTSLTMLKPLTVWLTTNCGKFLKR